jgi:hypothetical protein
VTRILALMAALFMACSSVYATEERPVNFIFLIDVSGSMLYKQTMVTAADGKQVTLFEALRQALTQIVQEKRLINSASKLSFITFGTKVTEKSTWPAKLNTDQDRQLLLQDISSHDQLDADKHGDTYMGGALTQALERANQMYSPTDPCTTTFIVMLTDGWDEPPAGATIKVKDVAAKLLAREHELFKQLGVSPWHVLVIGLQRLPEHKVGTTTAKELADVLGGGFIDVTKAAGGSVSEKIFLALKQAVESLKGTIELAGGAGNSSSGGGVHTVDFGTADGAGDAASEAPVLVHSCYAEQVSDVKDVTNSLSAAVSQQLLAAARKSGAKSDSQLASSLPANAITVKLTQPVYDIAPSVKDAGERKAAQGVIGLSLRAHQNCPAGHFVGALRLESSAKTPDYFAYMISVPGRLVANPEEIKVVVKKPGFLFAQPCETTLEGELKQAGTAKATYEIALKPGTAEMRQITGKGPATVIARLDSALINEGKAVNLTVDTDKAGGQTFKLPVTVPAEQKPGKYAGKLNLDVHCSADNVAPADIPYEIVIKPSAWEEVSPVAVPIFVILALSTAFGIFLWLTNQRRSE